MCVHRDRVGNGWEWMARRGGDREQLCGILLGSNIQNEAAAEWLTVTFRSGSKKFCALISLVVARNYTT